MVAKSYAKLEQVSEPFTENGRLYIYVITNNGTKKKVRWYSEKEYAKMYPDEIIDSNPIAKISQRKVLGFGDAGYITLLAGNSYPYKQWLKENGATYTRLWGWSIASDKIVPELPEGIRPIRLEWDKVSANNKDLANKQDIIEYVESLIYEDSLSEYQGEVGERLEIEAVCSKMIPLESYYGVSYFHTFIDDAGNEYVWSTASRQLDEGVRYHFLGTVKEHKVYKGSKQTILTRCKILD